jgi:hypothetical protein
MEAHTLLGQGHAAGRPVEQPGTETIFQALEASADRRRRQAERMGSPGEAPELGRAGKGLEIPQIVIYELKSGLA